MGAQGGARRLVLNGHDRSRCRRTCQGRLGRDLASGRLGSANGGLLHRSCQMYLYGGLGGMVSFWTPHSTILLAHCIAALRAR